MTDNDLKAAIWRSEAACRIRFKKSPKQIEAVEYAMKLLLVDISSRPDNA